MAQFPLTIEQFKDLHFTQKLSLSEIARRYGIKVAWISVWCKRNDIISHTKPTAKKDISDKDFCDAVSSGLSHDQLATKFCISPALVYTKLKQYNIKTNKAIKKEWSIKPEVTKEHKPQSTESRRLNALEFWQNQENRLVASETMRLKWLDPSYRERVSKTISDKYKDPEFRKKTSEAIARKWQDPEYRAKVISAHKLLHTNSEYAKTHTERSKVLWQDDDFKSKMAEICANPEYRKLLSQRTTLALAATDTRSKMAVARSKMPRTMTVPHKKVCDILTALDIRYEVEYPLGFYTYDLFLPEHKILIEVQGNYWHSLPNAVRNDKAKATYIERYQPELKLQYIWEHECLQPEKVLEKIKYWTGISKLDLIDYDFNSLKIGPVDKNEADTFLYTWHHQFHGRHGIDYGVYLQDQLISIARFTNTGRLESATQLGFKSNEVLELMRLCVHPKYQKKNLLTWFLSRVEKDLKQTKPEIKCLISFADTGHGHTGAVYKAANWTKHSVVPPSYHYIDLDGYVMHKRTLYSHAVKMKMKEAEYAEKYSFYKVPGMEKIKFIKYLR